jgi:D-alanine transaminase
MPSVPKLAFVRGHVIPFADASVPLHDRGLLFSESLYEVVPVTAGAPRLLPEHVLRMRAAAREIGLDSGVPAVAEWHEFVETLVERESIRDGLLYAQVTGGAAPREFVPGEAPQPTFFAYLTPFSFPRAEDVARGIVAVSMPDVRWARRDLKTTMLLGAVLAKREAKRRGASEAIFVGAAGEVYEGASSNVLAVEGRKLITPAQSSNLLPGTMRPLVGEAASEIGLEVHAEQVSLDRLARADEVLVCSTSQLLMPVVKLDDRVIGNGTAGPIGRDLAAGIRRRFELE